MSSEMKIYSVYERFPITSDGIVMEKRRVFAKSHRVINFEFYRIIKLDYVFMYYFLGGSRARHTGILIIK